MKSMTGYGRASVNHELGQITVEAKSVNGKALRTRFSMPRFFNRYLVELQNLVSKFVKRGDLDLFVNFTPSERFVPPMTVNYEAAKKLAEVAKRVEAVSGVPVKVSLKDLLSQPEVLIKEELEPTPLKEPLFKAVEGALKELVESREKEGEKLKAFFQERLQVIEEALKEVEEKAEGLNEQLFKKLKEKVENLLKEVPTDEEFNRRLELEVAILAEKQDATEEISRLKAHLKRFRELLNSDEPVGKTLDFLCQEMHREANTLGNKLKELGITDLVLKIKGEIARIKEQVQNVE